MSVRTSGKKKRQAPQRCPKCGDTERLTVAVTRPEDEKDDQELAGANG